MGSKITLEIDSRTAAFCLAMGVLSTASPLFAGAVAPLTTFTNGTVADATEVNANFAAIVAAVDDNDARIAGLSVPGAVGQLAFDTQVYSSTGDLVPEIYRINGGTGVGTSPPPCDDDAERGQMRIMRPSQQSDQDCLCVCMNIAGDYDWVCFNP
jgi:hypothetical protein